MSDFLTTLDVLYFNSLSAATVAFLAFTFSKFFAPRHKAQSRFFLYLSLGWAVNLLYLSFLQYAQRHPPVADGVEQLAIRSLNTISYFFFLHASRWKLRQSFRLMKPAILAAVGLMLLALLALAALLPGSANELRAPSIVFGIAAIAAIGANFHIHFRTTQQHFSVLTKLLLVYPMYLYALIQVGVFLLPPYSRAGQALSPPLEPMLFWAGMILKLAFLVGLVLYGEKVFREYQEKMGLLERAKVSTALMDQLAHELRTPAQALRIYVDTLEEGTSIGDSATGGRREVVSLIEQITALIDVFEKFQREHRVVRWERTGGAPCNLNVIVDAVVVEMKMTLRPKCRFLKHFTGGPVVFAIEVELAQIVRNLTKNAIEALVEKKRGEVGIVQIATEVDEASESVLLTISDNGTGVDESVGDIFADGVSTKSGPGRGHGLFIVANLVRKYGGDISYANNVATERETGATFTVRLPLYSE